MHRLWIAGILIGIVMMCGVITAADEPMSGMNPGPGNAVLPLPALPETGNRDDSAADQDFHFPSKTLPAIAGSGVTLASGSARNSRAPETSSPIGRYNVSYDFPFLTAVGAGTHPAVISRRPGKVDLFYWTAPDTEIGTLNTTAKYLGDLDPEFSWENALTTPMNHRFSPAVYSMNESHLGVFFAGTSRTLYRIQWTSASGWQEIETLFSREVNSTPAAVSRYDGNIELVYVDNVTGMLAYRNYSAGTWSSPFALTGPGAVNEDGVSLVSLSPDSFDVIGHSLLNNRVWIRHWNESQGWDAWRDTGITSYSFVGASARAYSDSSVTGKTIDIVTNGTDNPNAEYYWYISEDSGSSWYMDPSSDDGIMTRFGGVPVIVAPRYNRLEFYKEHNRELSRFSFRVPTYEKIGVYTGQDWALDNDSSYSWNAGDISCGFGSGLWSPLTGDWDGDGITEIGGYREADGTFFLDYNGNGEYDGAGTDPFFTFGPAGYNPVVGDWNRDGRDEIGVELDGIWALDYNGNYVWDGDGTDRFAAFGQVGDVPVVGDWNSDGKMEIGSHKDGFWAIDFNGNFVWDGTGPLDDEFAGLGAPGDTPVIGDWDGDGRSEIGMEMNGFWAIDYDGDFVWDGIGEDRFAGFGSIGDTPLVGDWNGNGLSEIASYKDGFWAVDYNGNYTWDGIGDDRFAGFGSPGAVPVVGEWR